MSPEALLCLRCGYFMLEYLDWNKGKGSYEVLGWGERWGRRHYIESFCEEEYVQGTPSRALWDKVWARAWLDVPDPDDDEPYVFFDYLYFGM